MEIGYLEAVVPVFRIPHPALDADGRQVGAANVFPARLRLERETEWRVCLYPGSRYRDDTPMNVTALKAMIKHWKPMLKAILAVREELRARWGLPAGGWTIGELFLLSTVCALPCFQLMPGGGDPARPTLHPVLSSLFRVTDGVRVATYEMMFDVDIARRPDERMTAAELFVHVERYGTLMGSQTGVCAGPRHMIEEYLAALIDGIPAAHLDAIAQPPEVQALLDRLPDVVDYGLRSLQSWGLALSVWVAHSQVYARLRARLDEAGEGEAIQRLRARLAEDEQALHGMQMHLEFDLEIHRRMFADAYERAWKALRAPTGAARHEEETAPVAATALHQQTSARLRQLLGERLANGSDADGAARLAADLSELLVDYLRVEQAVLDAVTRNQQAINQLLDRPQPGRALRALDFHAVFLLGENPYPYLFVTLERELDLFVDSTASSIEVTDRRVAAAG